MICEGKKLYVHYGIGENTPKEFTLIALIDKRATVQSILQELRRRSCIPANLFASCALKNESGVVLSKDPSKNMFELIEDHDDCRDYFAEVLLIPGADSDAIINASVNAMKNSIPPPSLQADVASMLPIVHPAQQATFAKFVVPPPAPPAEAKSPSVPPAILPVISPAASKVSTTARTTSGTTAATSPTTSGSGPKIMVKAEVLEAWRRLEEYMVKKQYKLSKKLIDVLIQNNFERTFAMNCLVTIHLHTKRFDDAIKHGKLCILNDKNTLESYLLLAKAYFGKKLYENAVETLEKAVKLWKNKTIRDKQPVAIREDHFYLDMIALQAECMFLDGDHNEAAALLNQVMSNPYCDRNIQVLVTYASFAFQYRKVEEAVIALLKSIALTGTRPREQQEPRVRVIATEIISSREGYDEFTRQFPPRTRESAEIYAYLGSTVKEASALDTAVSLYLTAIRLQPENPSYTLNLLHVYEIKQMLSEGLDLARGYYTRNSALSFGRASSSAAAISVACARMLEALQPPSSSTAAGWTITWIDSPSSTTTGSSPRSPGGGNMTPAGGYAIVRQQSSSVDKPHEAHDSFTFTPRDLDLLALYATTVKMLFLKGSLSQLPLMIKLIEKVRKWSVEALHETNVRNELAYYSHIARVMSQRLTHGLYGLKDSSFALNNPLQSSKFEFVSARANPLFFVGDSHILSSAWSILHVQDLPRLVIPKLVTGLKHWHLRPESKFYPKEHLYQTIATIPNGSDVVFLCGEIDCREGLLKALEQDFDTKLEDCMRRTITLYLTTLKELRVKKRFRIFVHPVPPVLNETRRIVVMYNGLMAQMIRAFNDDKIVWLDFQHLLLEVAGPEELSLHARYRHDGTHLSPAYLHLVEHALNELLAGRGTGSGEGDAVAPSSPPSSTGGEVRSDDDERTAAAAANKVVK